MLLVLLVNEFESTKDFFFTLLTVTISMMVIFIVKLVYFFLYRKLWKTKEDEYENVTDQKLELIDLDDN